MIRVVNMNDKDNLRQYRGTVRRDIDELEKKLDIIEAKLDKLNDNFEKHIEFIDNTYEGLKNPIKLATRFFKR